MGKQRNNMLSRRAPDLTPEHQQRTVHGVRDQMWPSSLMVFGIFTVLFTIGLVVPSTLIDVYLLFRIFLVLAFAGNLLPYLRSGLWLGMERFEWFMFNLLAIGPFGISLMLILNLYFHGAPNSIIVTNGTAWIKGFEVNASYKESTYQGVRFVDMPVRERWAIAGRPVRVTHATGMFGFEVILEREILER